jgi:hypothetical protein
LKLIETRKQAGRRYLPYRFGLDACVLLPSISREASLDLLIVVEANSDYQRVIPVAGSNRHNWNAPCHYRARQEVCEK